MDNLENGTFYENNYELSKYIKNDIDDLEKWSKIKRTSNKPILHFCSKVYGLTYYPIGEKWFDFHENNLGGLEKIGFKIRNYNYNNKDFLKMIDSFQSQLLNYGVICGLYFTVLFPIVLFPITISLESKNFFNNITINIFSYIHYCCIYFSLMQSLSLIFQASRYYLHLTVWMSNNELKYLYIKTVPIKTFIITSNSIIKYIIISLPFRIAVSVSPITGLISLLFAGYSMWQRTLTSYIDTTLCMEIHDHVNRIFNKNIIIS
jgi:hypothetical protein